MSDPQTTAAVARLQEYARRRRDPVVELACDHRDHVWTLRLLDDALRPLLVERGPELHEVINTGLDRWESHDRPTTDDGSTMSDEIEHDEHGFGMINQGYATARTSRYADEYFDLGQTAALLRAALTEHGQGQVHIRFAADAWEVIFQRPNEQITGFAKEFVDAIDDVLAKLVDIAREGG